MLLYRFQVKPLESQSPANSEAEVLLLDIMTAAGDFSVFDAVHHRNAAQEMRQQWMESIIEMFLTSKGGAQVQEFDLVLKQDGSVENRSVANPGVSDEKFQLDPYPVHYQIPHEILTRLDSNVERCNRIELFALGCMLYELASGSSLQEMMSGDAGGGLHGLYREGLFPDDLWSLPIAIRILACWCPRFAQEVLGSRSNDNLKNKVKSYIVKHPVLFGLQVVGGVASLASLVALPILGAVGFAAVGPVAGSTAAAWQASLGIVEAGSLFAWCQSAAMGCAAMGGILATGLTGAGVAVSAAIAGALDAVGDEQVVSDLKPTFLAAWARGMGSQVERP